MSAFFTKKRTRTEVVFYGLLLNAQLAAYAFKNAFHWIHVNMRRYIACPPPPVVSASSSSHGAATTTASGTTIARNSYADGVVAGLTQSVKEVQRERERKQRRTKERLAAKLLMLQKEMAAPPEEWKKKNLSASGLKGAAAAMKKQTKKREYEESDEEEDDSSDDDDDYSGGGGGSGTTDRQGDDSDDSDEDVPLGEIVMDEQQKRKGVLEGKIAKVEARLGKSDARATAEGALVVHQANVAEAVLKTADIKLSKASAYAKRAGFDANAYRKGREDSRNIDLDRRALGDK